MRRSNNRTISTNPSFTCVYIFLISRVIEVKRIHYRKKVQAKVLSNEIIELEYNPEDENGKKNLISQDTSIR